MIKNDFWDSWKNITPIERKAIDAVKKARELIIKSVPKEALFAIYIKGSFTRREMNAESDVDIVPIVTKNKFESEIFSVNDESLQPTMIVPLSLEEFKNNKLSSKSDNNPDLRAEPDLFLRKLRDYELIYGQPIDVPNFKIRTDKEILESEKDKILNGYIPSYLSGRIDFKTLLKEFFWFVEVEQNVAGKYPKHGFGEIASSVKDRSHIIHQALNLRQNKAAKSEEQSFVKLIESYLKLRTD